MFAYCLNNPVKKLDMTGMISVQSFGDETDMLSMPWKDPLGGGGTGYSAGYVIFAGLKYSENDDVRDLFNIFTDIVNSNDLQDILAVTKKLKANDLYQEGRYAAKSLQGGKKIVKGLFLLALPIPSPADEILGIRLIQFGAYEFIYGIVRAVESLLEE